jgi:hypothetical protein
MERKTKYILQRANMATLYREERKHLAQTHLQNIQANIKYRLDAARAKGDAKLVEMLEREGSIIHMGYSTSKFGM